VVVVGISCRRPVLALNYNTLGIIYPMVVSVILAAGKGTRMKSELPKVLHTINGVSMIKRVVRLAESVNSERIIVIVGYKAELIKAELTDFPQLEFVEQTQQLGTAHAIMQCREALADYDGPVLVLSGDTPFLKPCTIHKLMEAYWSKASIKTAILTGFLENPFGLGRIVHDHWKRGGYIISIVEEKDATDEDRLIQEVNLGVYVFDCKMLMDALTKVNRKNKQNEYYLTDVIEITLWKVIGVEVEDLRETIGINTIEQLKEAEARMAELGRETLCVCEKCLYV